MLTIILAIIRSNFWSSGIREGKHSLIIFLRNIINGRCPWVLGGVFCTALVFAEADVELAESNVLTLGKVCL